MHAVLKTAFDALTEELGHFDATTANLHPGGVAHCWTAAQIVEHLILAMDATHAELDSRLAKGRLPRNVRRTRLEWALQLMVLSAGYLPRGVPAPSAMVPRLEEESLGLAELLKRLEIAVEQMDASLDRARRKFGMERLGRHFLLGPMRVDQWRRYHVLHLGHHRKQIAAIRAGLSTAVARRSAMVRA
jgi:Protein of unknown function (DUF1569)